MMKTPAPVVALLIDGDNAQLNSTKHMLEFCKRRGTLRIRKAYGDWQRPPLSSHVPALTNLGLDLVQQDRDGKNATDFRLTADVDRMLDKAEANIYVIVSNDGHFTTACKWILQKGAEVIVIGSKSSMSGQLQDPRYHVVMIEDIVDNPSKTPTRPESKPAAPSKPTAPPAAKPKASAPATPKPVAPAAQNAKPAAPSKPTAPPAAKPKASAPATPKPVAPAAQNAKSASPSKLTASPAAKPKANAPATPKPVAPAAQNAKPAAPSNPTAPPAAKPKANAPATPKPVAPAAPKSKPAVPSKPSAPPAAKAAIPATPKPPTPAAPKSKPAAPSKPSAPSVAKAEQQAILEILIRAHQKSSQSDGWAHLGEIGNTLRQLDANHEKRFAGKKLSTWYKVFPHRFEVEENRVRMK